MLCPLTSFPGDATASIDNTISLLSWRIRSTNNSFQSM